MGLNWLEVIVKTDVSWVPVSSCSYMLQNSPLTFKLTVKSIILSSLPLIAFFLLKCWSLFCPVAHLPLSTQFSSIFFFHFQMISLYYLALLHLIFSLHSSASLACYLISAIFSGRTLIVNFGQNHSSLLPFSCLYVSVSNHLLSG